MARRFFRLPVAALAALLLAAQVVHAQAGAESPFGAAPGGGKAHDVRPQDIVQWSGFEAREDKDGNVAVSVRMSVKGGWKVYASNLSFTGPSGFTVSNVAPPPAHKFMDPIAAEEVDVYDGGEFTVTLAGAPRWQGETFPLAARYVGCTNEICLFPYTETVTVPYVAFVAAPEMAATPVAVAATEAPTIKEAPATAPPADPSPAAAVDLETSLARQLAAGHLSFGMILLFAFVGGLLSNLTPCVYPMIPITLRLLARQGGSAYASATFYALGIVVTYSALGLVAALSGGLFGSLLASKAFNLTFAVIMVALGVSMLGFGDFSKIQTLGSRLGSGKPSGKNAFLMGTGAGLVAAPCTGPILAAILAYAVNKNAGLAESTTLLSTYSLGFALPYIFLGGAAAKISAIKVPPQVQIAVKLFFASVMFGLGLYYLRIPFYGWLDMLRPHWQPAATVGLTVGLVLSAVWVIMPSLQNNKYSMILPSTILGIGIFAASQWLTSAPAHATAASGGVVWHKTEGDGFAAAKAEGKPILIDMWAEWCEACKKMDATTFVDPQVQAALAAGWITVKLDLTEDNPANLEVQERYALQGLPTLVLLPPSARLEDKHMLTSYVAAAALLEELDRFNKERAE